MYRKIAVFGVGLIGGSFGLAVKKHGLAGEIVGVGRRLKSLQKARKTGAIDSYTLDVEAGFRGAELILLAAPVGAVLNLLKTGLPFLEKNQLLTDACSTKKIVVETAEKYLPKGITFVGGHPIAGSEKRGPEAASADLFQKRVTVLTATGRTSGAHLKKIRCLWEALGSRVVVLTPTEHDRILSLTSHLPHLLAAGETILVKRAFFRNKTDFLGTGFRDFTRIAEGDPELWTDILLTNSGNLLKDLAALEKNIAGWKKALTEKKRGRITKLLAEAGNFQKRSFP